MTAEDLYDSTSMEFLVQQQILKSDVTAVPLHAGCLMLSGELGKKHMPQCRGRHAHLRSFDDAGCVERMASILLGASNSWFPITLSALSIPATVNKLDQLVDKHWTVLEKSNQRCYSCCLPRNWSTQRVCQILRCRNLAAGAAETLVPTGRP